MSKPKHHNRGKGYYVGYGYSSIECQAKKGCLDYKSHLINEIEDIKHRSGKHVVKLREYLKRVS